MRVSSSQPQMVVGRSCSWTSPQSDLEGIVQINHSSRGAGDGGFGGWRSVGRRRGGSGGGGGYGRWEFLKVL
jgi:hypothetical protein